MLIYLHEVVFDKIDSYLDVSSHINLRSTCSAINNFLIPNTWGALQDLPDDDEYLFPGLVKPCSTRLNTYLDGVVVRQRRVICLSYIKEKSEFVQFLWQFKDRLRYIKQIIIGRSWQFEIIQLLFRYICLDNIQLLSAVRPTYPFWKLIANQEFVEKTTIHASCKHSSLLYDFYHFKSIKNRAELVDLSIDFNYLPKQQEIKETIVHGLAKTLVRLTIEWSNFDHEVTLEDMAVFLSRLDCLRDVTASQAPYNFDGIKWVPDQIHTLRVLYEGCAFGELHDDPPIGPKNGRYLKTLLLDTLVPSDFTHFQFDNLDCVIITEFYDELPEFRTLLNLINRMKTPYNLTRLHITDSIDFFYLFTIIKKKHLGNLKYLFVLPDPESFLKITISTLRKWESFVLPKLEIVCLHLFGYKVEDYDYMTVPIGLHLILRSSWFPLLEKLYVYSNLGLQDVDSLSLRPVDVDPNPYPHGNSNAKHIYDVTYIPTEDYRWDETDDLIKYCLEFEKEREKEFNDPVYLINRI